MSENSRRQTCGKMGNFCVGANSEIIAVAFVEFRLRPASQCLASSRDSGTWWLEVAAAFHGFHHGDFVGVFEVGADRDAYADARDANAERFQQFRKIDGGGFAFGGGVRGHDDFFDGAFFQPFDERS